MFRYLNIFIILVIAYHREIAHASESTSKLLHQTTLQMSGVRTVRFVLGYPIGRSFLSDDELKCELT